MSKFFRVTLDKDVVLDDSVTNSSTGWTGEKVLKEIVDHRITRFESLDDVNVVDKKDGQIVAYSATTDKFVTIDLEAMNDAAGLSLKQLSKIGVIGTPTVPQVIDIPINTLDFKMGKLNILKFQLGDQNVVKTQTGFANGESNTFINSDMIIFDGTVHLKSEFLYPLTYEEDIDNYKAFDTTIDKSIFKNISDMSIVTSGTDKILKVTATPADRILIPKGDMNLSNVANVDYFNLIASPGLKIVCSIDSGVTYKTFNGTSWEDIGLTVDDVKAKGIDVSIFNSISSAYWNILITSNKIRFAYLLYDKVSIDELKIQYDAQGYWIEAKESTYDVVYASNNLLQVKLYFSGDVKINY